MSVRPLLIAVVLVAAACEPIIGPEQILPPDAVRADPLPEYEVWYAETEVCTGVTGDFSKVRWFSVPHERWWDPLWEQYAIGRWHAPHDIYVAAAQRENEDLVKHEIVHDLLRGGQTYDPRFEECSGIAHRP